MCRLRSVALALAPLALLALGWAASVSAQSLCPTQDSFPYTVAEQKYVSDTKYCFTLKTLNPQLCEKGCCNALLNKLELDVNPECKNVVVKATLNGIPWSTAFHTQNLTVGNNDPGKPLGGFRITDLGLNRTSAGNAEICVTITPKGSCRTMADYCKTPRGGVAGTCITTLFGGPTVNNYYCCREDGYKALPPPPMATSFVLPPINCTCNTTVGITPFKVGSPRVQPSGNPNTVLYCFSVGVINNVLPSTCGATSNLLKIEVYANQTLSSFVRSFVIFPATGGRTVLSTSWAGANSNVLKATPINWSRVQADGGKVCMEVKTPKTPRDICAGNCFLYLFNDNKKCCPVYML